MKNACLHIGRIGYVFLASMYSAHIDYYIAITGSASLQDTPLLAEFGDTGNALKAGPLPGPGHFLGPAF